MAFEAADDDDDENDDGPTGAERGELPAVAALAVLERLVAVSPLGAGACSSK